ncbi:MAG: spore coat protein CotJB [Clostridiales bacterium]|nr:spore coat protein CotJB [Candidatus Equinaster intestinalis]
MKNFDLQKRIYAYDFAIYEMVLYLDTHPTCARGLEKLARLRREREALVNEFERKHGRYIESFNDVPAETKWTWISGPWPWQNEAND